MRPPPQPGPVHPAWSDPRPVHGGVANGIPTTEPRRGWRNVLVSAQRTRLAVASCLQELVEDHSPAATWIGLVLDHRNTHSPASRAAVPPVEATWRADALVIPHPQHGSWLTMAELARCVLARQCLRQWRPDRQVTARAATARAERRTAPTKRIDWLFTSAVAIWCL